MIETHCEICTKDVEHSTNFKLIFYLKINAVYATGNCTLALNDFLWFLINYISDNFNDLSNIFMLIRLKVLSRAKKVIAREKKKIKTGGYRTLIHKRER